MDITVIPFRLLHEITTNCVTLVKLIQLLIHNTYCISSQIRAK